MLKINKIRNIGSFKYFVWNRINVQQQSEFDETNILFGENGAGKTTIVNIFKSINNNDATLEKNWDLENTDREIEIELEASQLISFDETNHWSNNSLKEKFVFFDRSFIDRYVHSGLSKVIRTHKHDKETGQLVLYLGNFYSYKIQLDKLRELVDKISSKNRSLKSSIEHMSQSANLDQTKYKFSEDIKPLIEVYKEYSDEERIEFKDEFFDSEKELSEEIENKNQITEKKEEIKNLSKLSEIELIDDIEEEEIKNALGFTLSKGALDVLKKIENKGSFIKTGLDEIKHNHLENCPFCEQPIVNENGEYLSIINDYDKIFDEEFIQMQNEVSDELKEYKNVLLSLLKVKPLKNNTESLEDINSLLNSDFDLTEITLSESDEEIIQQELENINKKLEDILFSSDLSFFRKIIDIILKVNQDINVYNKRVEEINSYLDTQVEKIKQGEIEKEIRQLVEKIENLRKNIYVLENFETLTQIEKSFTAHQKNKDFCSLLDSLIDDFRTHIQREFQKFVTSYFKNIKHYMKQLAPSLDVFQITTNKLNYDLRSNDVVCGFEIKYKGEDKFNALSEGEKQVIALAYFFAFLDEEKNKQEKYLVFDDPIINFDAGKRRQTAELIYWHSLKFKQSFIFTCDPLFRYYLLKVVDGNNRGLFNILKSASSCIYYVFKTNANVYASFKGKLQNISNVNGTEENLIVYGQMLRFCIEEVKETYLGYGEESFSGILKKVQDSDFDKLKDSIHEIKQIYSFCNTGGLAHYPRDGMTTWTELKFYTKKYFRLNL